MHDMETSFAHNPTGLSISRSSFFLDEKRLMTINSGALIPFYLEEVLPGDTFSVDTGILARMATPIHPVMDSLYVDYFYFFVPNRLVWDHWEEFNGANSKAWYQNVEYSVPQIKTYIYADVEYSDNDIYYEFYPGSVADFFGLPTLSGFGPVSALPFRAYGLIWNEWFRDQNLQDEIYVPTDDVDRDATSSAASDVNFLSTKVTKINGSDNCIVGGAPAPVAKLPDYFTTALPTPQKGPAVPLPIEGVANVYGRDNAQLLFNGVGDFEVPVTFEGGSSGDKAVKDLTYGLNTGGNGFNLNKTYMTGTLVDLAGEDQADWSGFEFETENQIFPTNLASKATLERLRVQNPIYADISASIGTINDLRLAFAIQRLYERDARGGTRYRELILSHFNVRTGDARVQVPEFLGGNRTRVGMTQVLQTSSSDSTSPQGNTAAYSLTTSSSSDFTKSFTEHGMVIGVMCIRQHQSYQDGAHAFWHKRDRFDFYWPALANIGNLPILNRELYASSIQVPQGSFDQYYDIYENSDNVGIFGYKEAWSEYRWKPDVVTGAFRSNYPGGSLDVWHYSNHFSETPLLSSEFIQESSVNVQRTLAVQDEPQFLVDVKVKNRAVRPLPLYSIPGLIDHN